MLLLFQATSLSSSRGSCRLKNDSDREAIEFSTRALMRLVDRAEYKLAIVEELWDSCPAWCWPRAPRGNVITTLPVSQGIVDVRPLITLSQQNHPRAGEWLQLLGIYEPEVGHLVPVADALVRLVCVRNSPVGQLARGWVVHQVATQIDQVFARTVAGAANEQFAVGGALTDATERRLQLVLASYVWVGRKKIAESWKQLPMISLTLDDSNVRGNEFNVAQANDVK